MLVVHKANSVDQVFQYAVIESCIFKIHIIWQRANKMDQVVLFIPVKDEVSLLSNIVLLISEKSARIVAIDWLHVCIWLITTT